MGSLPFPFLIRTLVIPDGLVYILPDVRSVGGVFLGMRKDGQAEQITHEGMFQDGRYRGKIATNLYYIWL